MKRLVTSLCLVLLLVSGCQTTSPSHQTLYKQGPWQRGYVAYNSGDYATTLTEWRPLAEQGVTYAQHKLGYMYANGQGVPQNYKTAVKWYRLAAEQGHAEAQYDLGEMYDKGLGVPQDYKTAVKWWKLAAKRGFLAQGASEAQFSLGYMYEKGQGVPKDYKTALKWYRLAAEQGMAKAQHNLGSMYFNGWGVPKDNKTAVKYLRLAAKQGHAKAKKFLKNSELKPFLKELEEEEQLAAIQAEKAEKEAEIQAEKAEKEAEIQAEKKRVEAEKAEMQKMVAPYKSRCSAFGFKDGSKEMSKCIFDLYKLENAKSQTRTVIQNNSGDSSAVRALLEEQRKQRQFEGSLELMKRGLDIMNPPTTRCQFNSLMKTMVCR